MKIENVVPTDILKGDHWFNIVTFERTLSILNLEWMFDSDFKLLGRFFFKEEN